MHTGIRKEIQPSTWGYYRHILLDTISTETKKYVLIAEQNKQETKENELENNTAEAQTEQNENKQTENKQTESKKEESEQKEKFEQKTEPNKEVKKDVSDNGELAEQLEVPIREWVRKYKGFWKGVG